MSHFTRFQSMGGDCRYGGDSALMKCSLTILQTWPVRQSSYLSLVVTWRQGCVYVFCVTTYCFHIVHVCSLTWSLSFRLCWRFYQGDPDIQSRHESLLFELMPCVPTLDYSYMVRSSDIHVSSNKLGHVFVSHRATSTHDRIDKDTKSPTSTMLRQNNLASSTRT